MTHQNTPSGGGRSGGAGLAFVVGGLLVAVAVIAWFVFARGMTPPEPARVEVDVNLPKMEAPKLPPVEPPTVPGPAPSR
jgi:hypothetical protein